MSDYLKQVEEQLVELTERGAHRRPRPRLDLAAVAAAVAVVVAVVLTVSALGGGAHRTSGVSHPPPASERAAGGNPRGGGAGQNRHGTATTPVIATSGAPVPAGFQPESFTAIGELTWWLLGTRPCASPPCTAIVRTTDGGRSFFDVPAPPASNFSELRFADPSDGFAYGPGLWVTHNGGASWHAFALGGRLTELAIGRGYVYAIVQDGGGSGRLMRAAIGSDVWSQLPLPGNDAYSGLSAHANDVVLEASGPTQSLEISSDDGASFTSHPVPPSVTCQFAEPGPPVVWEHCATGMLSGVWRSADGGRTFQPAGSGLPELPNSAAFAAASESTAVVGFRQLDRTIDGGASWRPVSGPADVSSWRYLGFTDPTHGVALGETSSGQARLYYTTDGGASYHLVRIG